VKFIEALVVSLIDVIGRHLNGWLLSFIALLFFKEFFLPVT
jgi:hypothetical protein